MGVFFAHNEHKTKSETEAHTGRRRRKKWELVDPGKAKAAESQRPKVVCHWALLTGACRQLAHRGSEERAM